jgi:soluble lytic murein transglycosylase-like protein
MRLIPALSKRAIMHGWAPLARLCASQFNISASLILAVIEQESAGDFLAESNVGAVGLMQIMRPCLDDFNRANGSNFTLKEVHLIPALNVRIGSWYLAWLLKQFEGDEFRALRAYNVGIGTVQREEDPEAGVKYASKVQERAASFSGLLVNS